MSRAMFEYTKTVLNKVSFDPSLFCKEVQKAILRLLPHEIEELKLTEMHKNGLLHVFICNTSI